jgi:cyclin B
MNSSRILYENALPASPEAKRTLWRAPDACRGLELLDPIDLQDATDPQRLSCYAQEITANLYEAEVRYLPSADYMVQQHDINYKMRAILLDWLVSVHLKFRLLPETLFLTVSLIDRYLAKRAVARQQLQLIGVTAMFIASKYEEVCPPELKDFLYVTDQACTRDQLIMMELDLLQVLQFSLTVPTAWRFLERFCRLVEADACSASLAQYLCELALVDYHMVKHKPSLQAAAALFLALKILKIEPAWTPRLELLTTYAMAEVRVCAKDMLLLFQAAPRHALTAVWGKFSSRDFFEVSRLSIA